MALEYAVRQTFSVPVTSGNYAPERVQLNSQSTSTKSPPLLGVTVLVEVPIAASTFELWLLSLGADPTVDANYFFYDFASNGKTWALASFPGGQIRMKSGGTLGTATLTVVGD